MENFVIGVFGDDFRSLIEFAAENETDIFKRDIDDFFGATADEIDRIEEVQHKNGQWYLALTALTDDESQDIVTGVEAGNGAEAWRKLVKRWDPVVAGRNRALLKTIISPERCKLAELSGVIEKWEASVRKYERRKDERGNKLKLTGDLKMAAFESLLPQELENHLVLNKKRLNTFEAQKEEIEGILDSRIGASVKELQIKPRERRERHSGGEAAMDVDAFMSKGKDAGKGKGGKKGSGGKWGQEIRRCVLPLRQAGSSRGRVLVQVAFA